MGFLALTLLPSPEILRTDGASFFLIGISILIPVNLIFARPLQKTETPVFNDLILPALFGTLFTVIYWYRIMLGSHAFEEGLAIKIGRTLFFWMPAVFFVCLYRSPDEKWFPKGRLRFLKRIGIGLFAGFTGVVIAMIFN